MSTIREKRSLESGAKTTIFPKLKSKTKTTIFPRIKSQKTKDVQINCGDNSCLLRSQFVSVCKDYNRSCICNVFSGGKVNSQLTTKCNHIEIFFR